MAHVTLEKEARGVIPRLARRYTRHRFGQMVEPTAAAAHHSGVLVAMGVLETAAGMGWKKLDPTLRWLAIQSASTQIGCSWCIDYGYFEGMHDGIDPEKVRAASRWRECTLFDERERLVLEYAESGHRVARPGDRRAGRSAPCALRRGRDRRAGGVGRAGELPFPLQCRTRTAEPRVCREVRGPSVGSVGHIGQGA